MAEEKEAGLPIHELLPTMVAEAIALLSESGMRSEDGHDVEVPVIMLELLKSQAKRLRIPERHRAEAAAQVRKAIRGWEKIPLVAACSGTVEDIASVLENGPEKTP